MGCGCSTKTKTNKTANNKLESQNNQVAPSSSFTFNENSSNPKILDFIVKNFIKIASFSLALLFLPIIMLAVIWFMFQLLVLNQEIDMRKVVTTLSSKIRRFNDDYDDEDEYDEDEYDDEEDYYDEENYEALDVEEITPSQSNK